MELYKELLKNSPNYYLEGGNRTKVSDRVEKLANEVEGDNFEEIIKKIMVVMNQKVHMVREHRSKVKFKRSSEEIVSEGNRNGCGDSSTLFVSLCRAKGIPAVQIITLHIPSVINNDLSYGHFFFRML